MRRVIPLVQRHRAERFGQISRPRDDLDVEISLVPAQRFQRLLDRRMIRPPPIDQ